MKKTITILFLFCSILSFGQISAARKLLLAQENRPIQYTGTGGVGYSTTTSMDVPYPAGIVAGDVLVLTLTMKSVDDISNGHFVNFPGWTYIGSEADFGYDIYTGFYYRKVITPISGTLSVSTVQDVTYQSGIIYKYSGSTSISTATTTVGSYYYPLSWGTNTTSAVDEFNIHNQVVIWDADISVSTSSFNIDYHEKKNGLTFTAVSGYGTGVAEQIDYTSSFQTISTFMNAFQIK